VRCVSIVEGKLRLVERETPDPGPYDVVVAVRGAGINAADLMQRDGYYPAPEGWPEDIPGMELAGVVSAVGDRVHEPLLGRRVCAIVGGGAQATHCLVPSEHLLFVPDHVSWDQAGGFPEAFTTAHDALVTQGQLQSGERVLISGATGGVGVAAVQIAHALGAHVTAVTRTTEHHERLRECGADDTVTLDQVADLDRVDVVLELVGAANLTNAQRLLRPFARVVVIGVSGGGSTVDLDLRNFMGSRSSLMGSTLRSRSRKEKGDVADRVNHTLVPRWRTGELHVPVARTFSLEDVDAAYTYFAEPGKFGKVVLRVEG
jgi:NADPH2:quinone reductase